MAQQGTADGIAWFAAGTPDPARPSLLLIHGAGGNSAAWWQQVEAFAPQRHVIAYDLPGFGQSAPFAAGEDLGEAMVRAAVAALHAAGAARADVVCQSLGGWTGIRLALARPDLVTRLALCCTLAGIAHPPGLTAFRTAAARMDSRGPASLGLTAGFEAAEPARTRLYRAIGASNPPQDPALGARLFAPELLIPPASLADLGIPLLLLMGEADPIWPPASLTGMLGAAPHAREQTLQAAGHSPYFEQPALFNDAIRTFLG
jgi:pimeloyl-ACP methyl ester carboxylesterase